MSIGRVFCLFAFAFLSCSCSIPNLEPAACIDARPAIREFYSFHFGNEMALSAETLKRRQRFLTDTLFAQMEQQAGDTDPFTTGTAEFPRAFRVGSCREIAPNRTSFQVLLFWRDEVSSEQRAISVEAARVGEQWLIDRINL